MANPAPKQENLKKNTDRTPKERKELARKAGKASGKVRKARKTLKEELLLLLSEGNMQKNVTVALLEKALAGDVKAFEVIRDSIGEKPVDKVESMNTNVVIDVSDLPDGD